MGQSRFSIEVLHSFQFHEIHYAKVLKVIIDNCGMKYFYTVKQVHPALFSKKVKTNSYQIRNIFHLEERPHFDKNEVHKIILKVNNGYTIQ